MRMLSLMFSLSLVSSFSFAQGDWWDKGNGGFTLLCKDTTEVFDLYELRNRYNETMTEERAGMTSLDAEVNYLLEKIARFNPTRAHLYHEWFKTFQSEVRFTRDLIREPADIGFGELPEGCVLRLTVFQRIPGVLNPNRYTIYEPVWEQLDVRNKAALILHELIYREANDAENRHLTSERSRYFNAWIHSQEFNFLSLPQYLNRLQALHFHRADYGPYSISLGRFSERAGGWEESELSFHDSIHPSALTILSLRHIVDWIPTSLQACLLKNSEEAVIHLSATEEVQSVAMKLPHPNVCALNLDNQELANGKFVGYRGLILGSTFEFFKNQSFNISGTYPTAHRFYFGGYRFETVSPSISIVHSIQGSKVQRIQIQDTVSCISPGTKSIEISTDSAPSKFEMTLENIRQITQKMPTCSPPRRLVHSELR